MHPSTVTLDDVMSRCLPDPNSGCWLWNLRIDRYGYGRYGRSSAHRVSYTLANGPVPSGMQLDHLCRVRCCVNPAHLEPVTPRENIMRGIGPELLRQRKLAITHCAHGHEFTKDNTRYRKNGERFCRACAKVRAIYYNRLEVIKRRTNSYAKEVERVCDAALKGVES